MDDVELREVARKAGLGGAAQAMLSLREENMAHAEETDELQLPDHSEEGMELLLYILQTAPSEDQAIMHACRIAAEAMRRDTERTELDKRMLYRQMVIAVGYMVGKPDDAKFMAEAFEEVLLLDADG